ncbi:MAG: hypothetical protein M1839_002094 [Geoglossum umbratile]|nr:MAG: hypothetical protein M1839_002094 [Geoglossum umbratile]
MVLQLNAQLLANQPIGQGLEDFCDYFHATCTLLGLPLIPESIIQIVQQSFNGSFIAQRLLFNLAHSLANLPAISLLPSILGRFNLREDLFVVLPKLIAGELDLALTFTFFDRILGGAPDIEIWAALYDLFTPDSPAEPIMEGTDDSTVDGEVAAEVEGSVYSGVQDFYKKYFEGKPWSSAAERAARAANRQRYWLNYPLSSGRGNFLSWFDMLQATYFPVGRGAYYRASSMSSYCRRTLRGVEPPDLFLSAGDRGDYGHYTWEDMWVIGKVSNNDHVSMEDLHGLYAMAREVFASQPTRLFLHAFLISGLTVEMWVYDRSGPYSSAKFSLHEDSGHFVKILASFTMMSDEDLGLDTYIQVDAHGPFIMLKQEGKGKEVKLRLYPDPIVTAGISIVSRGTTCYRAKTQSCQDWDFVAKFSWRPDATDKEDKLLRLAEERGVWGVSRLVALQTITSTKNLRRGLVLGKPGDLKPTTTPPISFTKPQVKNGDSQLGGVGRGQKRRKGKALASRQPKRPKTGSTIQVVPRAKEEPFANRTFCCLVISPPGRSLRKFQSNLELLMAFRDAVKGHRSLYATGKILHRDISDGNIIITSKQGEGDPVGILIDLDMSCEIGEEPKGQRFRTGTLEFMAIGVLKAEEHRYDHDLESIFYVFLWIIITNGGNTPGETSILREWYDDTYENLTANKLAHINPRGFQKILAEFPSRFQSLGSLALELHRVLFPYPSSPLVFSGAREFAGPVKLYSGMIKAFEKAIAAEQSRIEWEEAESSDDGVDLIDPYN